MLLTDRGGEHNSEPSEHRNGITNSKNQKIDVTHKWYNRYV